MHPEAHGESDQEEDRNLLQQVSSSPKKKEPKKKSPSRSPAKLGTQSPSRYSPKKLTPAVGKRISPQKQSQQEAESEEEEEKVLGDVQQAVEEIVEDFQNL